MGRARVCAVLAAALMMALPATAGAAEVAKRALTFQVMVGANRDQPCTVVADLYTPAGTSKANPAPAILATNGFGGSKADFDTLGASYAQRGYVFLAYSGLGFGGSGCKITLDDREHDGAAGSQLIDFLAGTKAAEDGTRIDYVARDDGEPTDPLVGMIGGSYGGQIQFAVAAVDPRLDTIIPQITWNDLSYSLSPNNTDFTQGVTYGTPGVVKIDWPVLFFGLGTGQGLAAALADPSHVGTCPNFADEVCPALINGASKGYLDDAGVSLLRNASVSSYYDKIKIPVFLTQGQSDNLFDLQESVTTYKALKARGVPVKLLWRSAGHSGGGLGDAENDETDLEAAYESRLDLEWFDHYLKGSDKAPALDFDFLTDWLPYEGDAGPSVGSTPSYPAAADTKLFLSGTARLVPGQGQVTQGSASMASVAAPTSMGGGVASPAGVDPPGTSVAYKTAPLEGNLDLVGVPSVSLRVDAPTFAAAPDPAAKLILFAKLYDVAPDGSATLNRNLISAARVGDASQPVTIELPGLAHRYAKGHSLRLTISTSAATYRGSFGAGPVTISTSPKDPSVLTVPALGAQRGAAGAGPQGTTAFTPAPAQGSNGTRPVVNGSQKARKRRAARFHNRRGCKRNPRQTRFHLRRGRKLKVARFYIDGKRVRTVRHRFRRHFRVRGLPAKRKFRIVVRSKQRNGVKRHNGRRYPACG